jgi:galactose mutarotase-like enzyme
MDEKTTLLGRFEGMDFHAYRATGAHGSTDIRTAAELSVAHCLARAERAASPAMAMGSLVHTCTLEPDALVITLEIHNLADEPVPASLGLHPYLSDSGSLRLESSALVVWERDAEGIPSGVRHLPPAGPCNLPHRIARAGLDHCYDGWTGRARIRWLADQTVLCMETQGSRCLHVYAPSAQDYVCLEPVSARPDAFNPRPDDLSPLPIVAPLGSLRLGMRLRVESWPVSAPREVAPPRPPA